MTPPRIRHSELDVICPTCNAEKNKSCTITTTGETMSLTHRARFDSWQRREAKKQANRDRLGRGF